MKTKILNFGTSNLCNISTNLSHGINRYTSHTSRSISLIPPPFGFDVDIPFKENEKQAFQLINESDLLHLNSWYFSSRDMDTKTVDHVPIPILSRIIDFYDWLGFDKLGMIAREKIWWHYLRNHINKRMVRRKKIILQYHGSDLRMNMSQSDKHFIDKHGFKVLVSVPDLLPQLKNTQWLPIPIPIEDELYKPASKRDDRTIKIVHSPTEKESKKTIVLINAVQALKRKYDVELMLIENKPYKECLRLKKQAHISFDNIEFGSYAGCSIEAMAHEQPTLVYLNDVSLKQINDISAEIGIEPPFVNVGDEKQPSVMYLNRVLAGKARNIITDEDYKSVYENLERLIVDSPLRKELGKRGRRWASRVHDIEPVVKRLTNIYES